MGTKKQQVLAKLALLTATLIWGFSFVVLKNSLNSIGPYYLMAIRFSIAAAILAAIFAKRLKALNRAYVLEGFALGVLLFLAYGFQTVGLTMTTPGKNAFLTAVYCVIVPFLYWALEKSRPSWNHFLSAFLCLIGIGFVSLDSRLSANPGDLLTLVCGLMYAVHVIYVSRFTKGEYGDVFVLTALQFAFAAIFFWICGFAFEEFPRSIGFDAVIGIAYLAGPSSAIALLFQNLGQKYTHPATASIIMSLEGVFGAVFSMLFGAESLTGRILIGFALIFIAEALSQIEFSHKEGSISTLP